MTALIAVGIVSLTLIAVRVLWADSDDQNDRVEREK